MTNAMKALISTAINAGFGVLLAFDIFMTQEQIGAIMLAVNAVLAIIVAATANASPVLAANRSALTGGKSGGKS